MASFTDSGSDSSSIPHWPTSWPENNIVDLDNLGDPGFWIEEQIPDPAGTLFGNTDEDDELANELTYAYIRAASELSFPLPSDFDAKPEETRKMVKDDFLGFIREWRRLALAKSKNEVSLNPDERTQQSHRKVVTWELLKEFGFTPDADIYSDVTGPQFRLRKLQTFGELRNEHAIR
jgi:hypothetical protein